MIRWLYDTLHPEIYHGLGRRPPFFQGWYFRLTNAAENQRYAVIPGIFLGPDPHAFIQVLEGHTRRSAYHRFPVDQFQADRRQLKVRIGESVFSLQGLHLALNRSEPLGQIRGEVIFQDVHPWPVRWYSPGIMGWYAWVPWMECYHGVFGFEHRLNGFLDVEGQSIGLDGGRGYIESDWGRAFPSGYIWFQTNHFDTPGICLTASIAIIPWLRTSFRGFIVGFWHSGKLHRFTTYSGARTERLQLQDDQVEWVISDNRYRLEMRVRKAEGGLFYGPTRHDMGKRVDETLDASVRVRLSERSGKVLFDEQGRHAGLEINGDIPRLLKP